jgi:hypothetical protein
MGFGTGLFVGWLAFSGREKADPAGCLFFFEMTLIAGTVGVLYESWWVFFLAVAGLFAIVRIKYLLVPLLVFLTAFWGLVSYNLCEHYGHTFSNKALITLLILVLTGFAHYNMWGRLKRSH